jgi:hypothetical protein
LTPPLHEKLL